MKIALGSMILESNTFSPIKVGLDYFCKNGYLKYGTDVLEFHAGVKNEVAGFLDIFNEDNCDVYPLCSANAVPTGILKNGAYKELQNIFLSKLSSGPAIDVILLALHGSMVVEGIDDPEGVLL